MLCEIVKPSSEKFIPNYLLSRDLQILRHVKNYVTKKEKGRTRIIIYLNSTLHDKVETLVSDRIFQQL